MVEKIVKDYTSVVGALDQMFKEIDLRSNSALWRWKGDSYKVGTCKNVTKKDSEESLRGVARTDLIILREERAATISGSSKLTCCPYHREDMGCILEELKSPLCISHIDNPQMLNKSFGVSGAALIEDIRWILMSILECRADEQFTQNAHLAVTQMTNHIKKFPILHSS